MSRWVFVLQFLPVLLLMMAQAGCAPENSDGRLQVVASIEPLAYFVERIGGDLVSVSVMVPPGGNPHSYEPTPKQMARLGEAALFVKAGSGVEFELDWMQRFLALNKSLRVCDASSGVRLMAMKRIDGHDGEKHHHGRFDPHYWLSPSNAILIAHNIEQSLSAADPAHREHYARNCASLRQELQALESDIQRQLAVVSNRRFLVFHPAWGYYAEAFGLEQSAAEVEGKTLTPGQMERVIGMARAHRIGVVFVSPQFSTAQAEAIANDIGGSTVVVDPLARDYQNNLRRATAAFIRAMQ